MHNTGRSFARQMGGGVQLTGPTPFINPYLNEPQGA